jgi:cell division initiation protein
VPIDPAAVRAQEFRVVFRGYDVAEVDAFLDWVESELTRTAGGPGVGPAAPATGDPDRAVRTLLHAERAAEQMLAEAAAEAAAIRDRAHAEARAVVAEARTEAERVAASAHRLPAADVEELAARGRQLRAELDRLGESERRCREQLQTWLDESGRLLEQRATPAGPDALARRDPGTTVRRVVTTLPLTAVR